MGSSQLIWGICKSPFPSSSPHVSGGAELPKCQVQDVFWYSAFYGSNQINIIANHLASLFGIKEEKGNKLGRNQPDHMSWY